MSTSTMRRVPAGMLIAGLVAVTSVSSAEEPGPHDWLDRMATAVQTTTYEGTVIRLQNGEAEALKVAHKVRDGVVQEKVIVQEGDGLEIIRNGTEVYCVLPERKSVLVEDWTEQSTLFSTLPSSDLRFGNEYDVLLTGYDRVAGRKTVKLSIRPHDSYRYEHRLWLDVETAFPLQTQLVGESGQALAQVKFADIALDSELSATDLESSYSTDSFKWYSEPQRPVRTSADTDWQCGDLPPGFEVISTQREQLPDSEESVTHILYSDGLASVSVFIAAGRGDKPANGSRVGVASSYSTSVDGHHITAVGEVPAMTVEQIATSMRRRP